ncbi:phosphotransferase [Rhodobacterales bacterium HKCCE3408]|nr:phosphotransferase [Rhodobacterales bacterium HKCCE3408]
MSVEGFLAAGGWNRAAREPLAGDASGRRYTRLRQGAMRAILMEAPPDQPLAPPSEGRAFGAFVAVADWLRGLGLSAPEIRAADAGAGLMLMEDLGEGLFARLAEDKAREAELYEAAAGVTVRLAAEAPPRVVTGRLTPEAMVAMIAPAFDEIPGDAGGLRAEAGAALMPAFAAAAEGPEAVALRDYHAGNLVWMPQRDGLARVGLLDFQDAMRAPAGYDLASLLDDPRRDVPDALRARLIAEVAVATGDDGLARRVDLLSWQRNLRILGIFRRVARERGRPAYLDFLPRTGRLIAAAAERLEDRALSGLTRDILAAHGLSGVTA